MSRRNHARTTQCGLLFHSGVRRVRTWMLGLFIAVSVLGTSASAQVQSPAPKRVGTVETAPVREGTLNLETMEMPNTWSEKDHQAIQGLAERAARFREAGFLKPNVSQLRRYSEGTILDAARQLEKIEDDCEAAVELSMFLNANVIETSLQEMRDSVDRPLWMTTKLLAVWMLPDAVGTGGTLMDIVSGNRNKFARIGPLYNALQSYEVFQEHIIGSAAVQQGRWAYAVYREYRAEDWDTEEVEAEMRSLQDQVSALRRTMQEYAEEFENRIVEEEALHAEAPARIEAAYQARLAAIAEDERTGAERARRVEWLRQNRSTGAPRPDMGPTIDPLRDPGQISLDWSIGETEPGGKYYREQRAEALNNRDLALAAEPVRYEVVMKKLGHEYDREMADKLTDISELEIERETLQNIALPLSRGECEQIGKPKRLVPQEAIFALPHDQLLAVLRTLGITPPKNLLNCVCRSAGYGSPQTSQFYHPDTFGQYDKRYVCQRPGEPCIVAGYGCLRFPLPGNPSIWATCAAEVAGPGEVPLTTAIEQSVAAWAARSKTKTNATRAAEDAAARAAK